LKNFIFHTIRDPYAVINKLNFNKIMTVFLRSRYFNYYLDVWVVVIFY